jgi:hypothetical protein
LIDLEFIAPGLAPLDFLLGQKLPSQKTPAILVAFISPLILSDNPNSLNFAGSQCQGQRADSFWDENGNRGSFFAGLK